MAPVQKAAQQRFVLENVNWEAYEALLWSWESRSMRTTYDRGRLEILSPPLGRQHFGALIGQMVQAFTLERRIPLHSGGSTPFRSEAKQRGLEPDGSYWIQNEPRMRSRKHFDPGKDPGPDLAVEVDTIRSSLDRMGVYADLGTPEVWRFDGRRLSVNLLGGQGSYEPAERIPALPGLPPEVVVRFLQQSDHMGEAELMVAFRD